MGSFMGLKMPTSFSAAPLIGAGGARMAPVVAAGFTVAPEFGYVVLTASASVILTQWQMFQVAFQRRRSGLKYPKMYEDAEDSLFNCYQRAHQNTLESYPAFLTLLVISGLAYPITASVFGMLWVVGRVVYSLGYYTGDPSKRFRGAFHNFGLWGLLVTSIVFGVRTVMPLLSA
ncbi:uncharacterized protein [Physcomitrium patens]|uniref:Glutathione S-transferase 3, mitochondrial n=1 Tax=Physcomitrium patens TaxID=3218 RepID=A0A2K1KHM6_PHYPA|nr:microsomal glutathione S-transferase 3-like [Physcomitrium patens]PNR53263.1 hypothetical protein PHYPA_009639 [Physcomitrium patens]|eukprot:XP_024377614.1 microsomal glutathione S-transferase 3-like [Physcomitrella patens]